MGRKNNTYIEVRERPWNACVTVLREAADHLNKRGLNARMDELAKTYPPETHCVATVKTTDELRLFDAMSTYPIFQWPTKEFMEQLRAEMDPEWTVKDLHFKRWGARSWQAVFKWGRKGQHLFMDMELGGKEATLEAIEQRVMNALKPGGKL